MEPEQLEDFLKDLVRLCGRKHEQLVAIRESLGAYRGDPLLASVHDRMQGRFTAIEETREELIAILKKHFPESIPGAEEVLHRYIDEMPFL